MRLLNTQASSFKEFFEAQTPKYAIISHRWAHSEVSYKEMLNYQARESENAGSGFDCVSKVKDGTTGISKILDLCRVARTEGYNCVWIDTCCIDSRSSAEVSEAINSMFKWYQKASRCYACLADVSSADAEFNHSEWFTRGWTIQELLAPKRLRFYNSQWEPLGPRIQLAKEVAAITGIEKRYLRGPEYVSAASVAAKMSWASRRKTTIEEDTAYCLLGLFDLNMPPLYGEGRKAFIRLQLEILKRSVDESIFAWHAPEWISGLLAPWPTAFADSGYILNFNRPDNLQRSVSTSKNLGIELELPQWRTQLAGSNNIAVPSLSASENILPKSERQSIEMSRFDDVEVQLFCGPSSYVPSGTRMLTTITLRRDVGRGGVWLRTNCDVLFETPQRSENLVRGMETLSSYYVPQPKL